MLTQIFKRFASTTKTYGGLKDSDRIFTNVYKDSDPYIKGALRRVRFPSYFRVIGIELKILLQTVPIGSSTKSKVQVWEVEGVLVSHLDWNIPSCLKLQPNKDQATLSLTLINPNLEHAKIDKSWEAIHIN